MPVLYTYGRHCGPSENVESNTDVRNKGLKWPVRRSRLGGVATWGEKGGGICFQALAAAGVI